MRAREIMSSPVVTVRPDTPVKRVAQVFAAEGFTALPVVDADGRLAGVVTEADVLRGRFPVDPQFRTAVDESAAAPPELVGQVMTAPAAAVAAGTDVAAVARVMLRDRHRCLPVVERDKVVGVVTRGDLIRVLARSDHDLETDVRRRLAVFGGATRWTVRVVGGAAEITDRFDDAGDRHIARVLAEAVPGVVRAEVHAVQEVRA
ncbi:CBS domain-containing protein [Actinokineospora auranticolor]|uniref:CBS domain protein n=1 Tax=Actinokineospora auranticolor TaxID=155976 RepID=A0A2S6GCL3_9PSEU|nr:CBS domain-containing protein [Actinokineospora auranticolor]PPK62542.1 CBS domain protein [Actinokineospora auranticolor]